MIFTSIMAVCSLVSNCFGQDLLERYVAMDTVGVSQMGSEADGIQERLLWTYRLFPLNQDKSLLKDIPTELPDDATAADYAVLSALWAFKLSEAPLLKTVTYARRTTRLLEKAKSLDPDDPITRLVDAQGLIYKPLIAGGNKKRALEILRSLEMELDDSNKCDVSRDEVRVWIWKALVEMNDPTADAYRKKLLAADVGPMFETFLTTPP